MEQVIITEELSSLANNRLDKVLASIFTDYSRSQIKKCIDKKLITVNGSFDISAKDKVALGSIIKLDRQNLEQNLDQINFENNIFIPENISLNIIYQDEDVIIINKPDNLVVHPAAGNWSGTLVNGLVYHFPELSSLPRAGIIHRLDKDTTGLMVVARNLKAHNSLVQQLQNREVSRKYLAIVYGNLITSGYVEEYMGRHPTNRLKMAVLDSENKHAKYAKTYYKILKKYKKHTLLELKLETGRTHQIRVHMAHLGYPIIGDALYSNFRGAPKEFNSEDSIVYNNFKRQALSAVELGFKHPSTNKQVSWQINNNDLPIDIKQIIDILDKY